MVACGHSAPPAATPVCSHIQRCGEASLSYVKWYTGTRLNIEFLCEACANARVAGAAISTTVVCEACLDRFTDALGDLVGARGAPEIRTRPASFDPSLVRPALPFAAVDIASIEDARSTYLVLGIDGRVS